MSSIFSPLENNPPPSNRGGMLWRVRPQAAQAASARAVTRVESSNPIFRDDPDQLLLDLKQCAADCIGPGCEPRLSPPPGHDDQSASLAAPAEADQVEGTPVNPFSSFLSSEIKRVRIHLDAFGVDYFDRPALENYLDDLCRASSVYSRFLRTNAASEQFQ